MRKGAAVLVVMAALGFASCTREDSDAAARKAGKAAHEITKETEKAARKAGRELKQAGKEAHEGWKEAEREDRAKAEKK